MLYLICLYSMCQNSVQEETTGINMIKKTELRVYQKKYKQKQRRNKLQCDCRF
jgi:hypothetical protein